MIDIVSVCNQLSYLKDVGGFIRQETYIEDIEKESWRIFLQKRIWKEYRQEC